MKKIMLIGLFTPCLLCFHAFSDEINTVALSAESAEAQYNLATRYQNGDGVDKDFVKAVEWYEKAAEQEHAKAQHRLGMCYMRGLGVKKNIPKAFDWLRKAIRNNERDAENEMREFIGVIKKLAEDGDAEAQYSLAMCHIYGTYDTPTGLWPWNEASGMSYPDIQKATELFIKAAQQGHAAAQYQIVIYLDDSISLANIVKTINYNDEARQFAISRLTDQTILAKIAQDENVGDEIRQAVENRLNELKFQKNDEIDIPLP